MAASRLRGPSDPPVRLLSKVGGDINGSALLAELEADGVDTSWCARAGHGHATPTSFILVSGESRTIIHDPGFVEGEGLG